MIPIIYHGVLQLPYTLDCSISFQRLTSCACVFSRLAMVEHMPKPRTLRVDFIYLRRLWLVAKLSSILGTQVFHYINSLFDRFEILEAQAVMLQDCHGRKVVLGPGDLCAVCVVNFELERGGKLEAFLSLALVVLEEL